MAHADFGAHIGGMAQAVNDVGNGQLSDIAERYLTPGASQHIDPRRLPPIIAERARDSVRNRNARAGTSKAARPKCDFLPAPWKAWIALPRLGMGYALCRGRGGSVGGPRSVCGFERRAR